MKSEPPLGVVAGAGELPLLVARNAVASGRDLAVVALRGCADPSIAEHARSVRWRGIAQLGRWIRALRSAGCREVVMVGRVSKVTMFSGPRWLQWLQYAPDLTSIRVWYFHARDKRNDTLLRAVAAEMARRGLTMIDSTAYIPEALAPEGWLFSASEIVAPATNADRGWKTRPMAEAPANLRDAADFAWPLIKQIAALDIGQSIAVKEREVIAVEAIEGTDRLIERAGALCPQGGWTLVKVAKPNQDMRFDVPTIGPQTIENLVRAGARGLVIEAGKTIVLERVKTLATAQRLAIAILSRRGP